MLEPPRALDDDVEANPQAPLLGMLRKPRSGGVADPAHLLGVHHLQRVVEPRARLALHLAEDDRSPTSGDDVELVPAGPGVRIENPVSPQAVPAGGSPLGVVPRLVLRLRLRP